VLLITIFFSKLLDGVITSTLDEDGAFLIDRNGELFKPILDYLRTGELEIPTGISWASIQREADFYLIDLPNLSRSDRQLHVIEVTRKIWVSKENRESEIEVIVPLAEPYFMKLMESRGFQSIDTQCWFFRQKSKDSFQVLSLLNEFASLGFIIKAARNQLDPQYECLVSTTILQKHFGYLG